MRFINANAKYRIRKIVVYAIYIFLLSSLQVSFPDSFGFLGQTADLMFVFVVLSGYFNGFWDGAVVGFVCGLVRDVFSPPAVVGLDGEVRVTAFIGVFTLFAAGIVWKASPCSRSISSATALSLTTEHMGAMLPVSTAMPPVLR